MAYLTVKESINNEEGELKELGKYCGSTIPKPFMTSENTLHIYFKSNSMRSGSMFRLEWITNGTLDQILKFSFLKRFFFRLWWRI